jgi:hypothetical protein
MTQLAAVNPNVCKLTLIKHVASELDNKFLTQLKETLKTGKVGKPAHRFIRTAVNKGLKTARKARGGTPEATPTPIEVSVETVEDVSVPISTGVEILPQPLPVVEEVATLPTDVVEATLEALATVS